MLTISAGSIEAIGKILKKNLMPQEKALLKELIKHTQKK